MTMTLDSVPAKLNELDLRAPLEVFEAIEAAIKQREQGANNPLKGWIFDKVNMGRGAGDGRQ